MSERRYPKLSIRGPVTLFVVVLVLIITLTVLWNVILVHDYQKLRQITEEDTFHWSFVALGSALFLAIIVLSSILSAQLIAQIRWSQRQSNFIASVSHELNSPLSSIKLFTQTLRTPDLSVEDRLNFVQKILDDVERLHRLIANILRAAETDYHGDDLQVVPQAVELRSYLERYLGDAREVHRASGLRLELAPGDDDLDVRLDPLMFRQVLDNLLDNAVRYRGDGEPVVRIEASRVDRMAEIRVVDRGIGIAPEALPRLFERFYRIEGTDPSRKRQGTGIGLYVVRSIVQAHGGRYGALSAGPGKGTTMWIRLPLAVEAPRPTPMVEDDDPR
ncbi:MAG: HAMP domain-containing sensor histidine kinase [Acidobacteriota bacterium]